MIKKDNILKRKNKRAFRNRKSIFGSADRPRLSVFRSLTNIYAQLIDDLSKVTLLSVSTKTKEISEQLKGLKSKTEKSKFIGKYLAEKAIEKNITTVVFDRGSYIYHGRVKALADGAREGGLKF